MFRFVKYLLMEKRGSFLKYFFIFTIVTLVISSYFELYYYSSNELQNISDKTKIHVVFSKKTNDKIINEFVENLKKNPKINKIVLISSEQAEQEFFDNYTSFSKELLTVNPFPAIVQFSVKREYFDIDNINQIIEKYIEKTSIEEIRFKKEFVESYSSIKKHFLNYFTFFSILILILVLIASKMSISNHQNNIIGDISNTKSKLIILSLTSILISLFTFSVLTIFLLNTLKLYFLWVNLISLKIIISVSTFTAVGYFILSLFTILLKKEVKDSK